MKFIVLFLLFLNKDKPQERGEFLTIQYALEQG